MRSEQELEEAMSRYADTVRRICFLYLKKEEDVKDAFQKIFLSYLTHPLTFANTEHEKAWMIRVSINCCKDMLGSAYRRHLSLDYAAPVAAAPDSVLDGEYQLVLDAVRGLEEKYRTVIYLHYYEGYQAKEIAALLGRRENTIYTWLHRERNRLREVLADAER